MKRSQVRKILSPSAIFFALLHGPVHSAPVVELFTSQGCYSCPPADEFLAELIAARPDLVALEYHVDYWDDLVYGAAGQWKDPFSDPSFTRRQRLYHSQSLRGRKGVYTPQMVINGATAQVGTSKQAVTRALDKNLPALQVDVTEESGRLFVAVSGASTQADAVVWLAEFGRRHETEIKNGENQGKTMINHHVVTSLVAIGDWQSGQDVTLTAVAPAAGKNSSCAILVQSDAPGPILGAAYCP